MIAARGAANVTPPAGAPNRSAKRRTSTARKKKK